MLSINKNVSERTGENQLRSLAHSGKEFRFSSVRVTVPSEWWVQQILMKNIFPPSLLIIFIILQFRNNTNCSVPFFYFFKFFFFCSQVLVLKQNALPRYTHASTQIQSPASGRTSRTRRSAGEQSVSRCWILLTKDTGGGVLGALGVLGGLRRGCSRASFWVLGSLLSVVVSAHSEHLTMDFFRFGPSLHLMEKMKFCRCCQITREKKQILYLILLIGFIIIRRCIIS